MILLYFHQIHLAAVFLCLPKPRYLHQQSCWLHQSDSASGIVVVLLFNHQVLACKIVFSSSQQEMEIQDVVATCRIENFLLCPFYGEEEGALHQNVSQSLSQPLQHLANRAHMQLCTSFADLWFLSPPLAPATLRCTADSRCLIEL